MKDMHLARVVYITGCSSGFGYGMALTFARNGDIVIAGVRNPKKPEVQKLKQIAETEKLALQIYTLDVTKPEQIKQVTKAVTDEHNRIDILINNAGYGYLGPVEDCAIEDVMDIHNTNVLGVLRMTQAVIPIMRAQKTGLIINFSSVSGVVPFPLFSIYSSTKYAIETITEGLRFELAHFGIDVVLVEPGSFATGFTENRKFPKRMQRADSPYRPLLNNFLSRYKQTHSVSRPKFISKVANPQIVVDRVYKISLEKKPGLRHLIGSDAWLYFIIRKLVPFPLWEKLLSYTYKW